MTAKTLLLPLFFVVTIWAAQAQNTRKLTSDLNTYRAGDQLVKQQVAYKDPGSSGRNLTWDFQALQPVDYEYGLNYFIPDSADMTLLCGREHRTRYYYRQQNDSLWATGYENATTYMKYTVPELRMRFPYTYGDTLSGNFEGSGQYGRRLALAVKGYTRTHADAEGELLLPGNETVRKALRVRTLRHYTQTLPSAQEEGPGVRSEMTLDTYSWYAAGIRYPVFESIKTTIQRTGSENDTTIFNTSFYYPPEKQILEIDPDMEQPEDELLPEGAAAVFTEARLLPNPVIDNLYIDFKLTRAAQVWFTVHNNIGIARCQTTPQNLGEGYNTTTINMSGLISGVYTVYVHVDDMVMSLNVVKR